MVIRTLTASDFDAVFDAFTAAFSDYVVPLTLNREQLAEMLRRRGWVPELSVAAFDGSDMVAFTLNGVDGTRAYDSGTGVVPTHRRRGLARELMLRSIEVLAGYDTYVLEVLENNPSAIALYRSLGFEPTRSLQCWRYEPSGSDVGAARGAATVHQQWWDIDPAWQNSSGSLGRATDTKLILGNDDAYAILFPSTGDLAQLAVRHASRRRGVGTTLLAQAAAIAQKPLRIMNVDTADAGIAAFLERAGAVRTVRQLEMTLRPLSL